MEKVLTALLFLAGGQAEYRESLDEILAHAQEEPPTQQPPQAPQPPLPAQQLPIESRRHAADQLRKQPRLRRNKSCHF